MLHGLQHLECIEHNLQRPAISHAFHGRVSHNVSPHLQHTTAPIHSIAATAHHRTYTLHRTYSTPPHVLLDLRVLCTPPEVFSTSRREKSTSTWRRYTLNLKR